VRCFTFKKVVSSSPSYPSKARKRSSVFWNRASSSARGVSMIILPEGTPQITSFLMPCDCGDLHASVSHRMEHSIATLTPARVAKVDRKEMEELIVTRPAIMRAFLWTLLVDEDTLRAWIVSMGRRDSVQRVAHRMCELYVRALNIGLTVGDRFEMPLTQIVLGDALGLTPVHVNRVLRKLKVSGVMSLSRGSLVIADVAKLAIVAGFDDNYLHRRLRRPPPDQEQ
jgi:CRP-like cAMP-binding protein